MDDDKKADESTVPTEFTSLTTEDMKVLEDIATRLVENKGSEFSYYTQVGISVTFSPVKNKNSLGEDIDGQEQTSE